MPVSLGEDASGTADPNSGFGLRRRGATSLGTRRSPSAESAEGLLLDRSALALGSEPRETSAGETPSCIPKKYSAILRKTRILGEKLIKEGGNTLSLSVGVRGVHELGRGWRLMAQRNLQAVGLKGSLMC